MPTAIRSTRLVCVILVATLFACSDDDPISADHGQVARVAIQVGIDEIAPTGHLPVTHGEQNRISLNLYDAQNHKITEIDHFQITLSFTPTDVASAIPVSGTTTFFDLTSSAAVDTDGSMMVSIYHPHTGETKTFGPFAILIH